MFLQAPILSRFSGAPHRPSLQKKSQPQGTLHPESPAENPAPSFSGFLMMSKEKFESLQGDELASVDLGTIPDYTLQQQADLQRRLPEHYAMLQKSNEKYPRVLAVWEEIVGPNRNY